MSDLVSILTPFKNTEHYLTECINSVVKQTHINWELILVDDHSTDRSLKTASAFAEKDHRIQVVKNLGTGIIEALRLAFSISKGNYITRMDSDDVMLPNKLEILLNNLMAYGKKHVAVGLVKYTSNNNISKGYQVYENWLNQLTKTGSNFKEIYKECAIPSPCWMIHREDLMACDAFKQNRYPEDYDLAFRFYEHAFKCIPCSDYVHLWREYSTRTSRTHKHYSIPFFLDVKLHYFLKIDHDLHRPLVIWGAGEKAKIITKQLNQKKLHFYWISEHPGKIGKKINATKIQALNTIDDLENPQHIITIARPKSQVQINAYFKERGAIAMLDYFFFC